MRSLFRDEESVGFDDLRRQKTKAERRPFISRFGCSFAVDGDGDGLFACGDALSRQGRAPSKNEILLRTSREVISRFFLAPCMLHSRHEVLGLRTVGRFALS